METPIRILIVDDHPLFRQGVRLYLESLPEFQIDGEVENGAAALAFLERQMVDVVLLDLQMPEMDGVETTLRIKEKWPPLKILALTSFNSWERVQSALKAGANGYVLKSIRPQELAVAVRAVAMGGSYLNAEITAAMVHQMDTTGKPTPIPLTDLIEPLTAREVKVLELIGQGMGNREIAEKLFLSETTVKTHVANILQKLQVKSRTQAALYFKEHFHSLEDGGESDG
ncbi:MAG TPA: response regulator transcription factor [Bacillota bacterium]|nr:response regulator transcription factor [Bacillota bacterium]